VHRLLTGITATFVTAALAAGVLLLHGGAKATANVSPRIVHSVGNAEAAYPAIPDWTFSDPGKLDFTPVQPPTGADIVSTRVVHAQGMTTDCICWLIEYQTGKPLQPMSGLTVPGASYSPPAYRTIIADFMLVDAKSGVEVDREEVAKAV
jgi:hypothetical protein